MSILEVTFSGLLVFAGVGGPEASVVHVAKAPGHTASINWLGKDGIRKSYDIKDATGIVFFDGANALKGPDVPERSFMESIPNLTTILGKTSFSGSFTLQALATVRLGGGRLEVPEGALRVECGFRTTAGMASGYVSQLSGTVRWTSQAAIPRLKGHLPDPTESESLEGATDVRIENIPKQEVVGTSHFGHYYDASNLRYSSAPDSKNLLHPCGLVPHVPPMSGTHQTPAESQPTAEDKAKSMSRTPPKPVLPTRSNPLLCPPVAM